MKIHITLWVHGSAVHMQLLLVFSSSLVIIFKYAEVVEVHNLNTQSTFLKKNQFQ